MNHSTVFRSGTRLLAAIALVAVVAGCGVSTDAVLDALPSATTTAPPPDTTAAPTTTEDSTTTEVPDTTDAPSTTAGPATTSGGGAGDLPEEAKAAFMQQCEMGQPAKTCECIWDAIEADLDVEGLIDSGSTGTLPDELQQKIVEATMACMFDTDS